MSCHIKDQPLQLNTTCGVLLHELQVIWDEVGEPDDERDRILLELEQECLELYRRKVDQANRLRAQLRQAIADSEAELVAICSAIGEPPVHLRQPNQNLSCLKEELKAIGPKLEELRKMKNKRLHQFIQIVGQIKKISADMGFREPDSFKDVMDESDLSVKRLEELHRKLEMLQKEKADRLRQVADHLNTINSLCLVLGMDFKHTISEVHPSLGDSEGPKSISNNTIELLASGVQKLRKVKMQRMQKLQDLVTSMLEMWHLMDTPAEEQQLFQDVTCNIAASEHEITEPNTLSDDFINHVGAEVARLEELKASKMKELIMRKRSELEELRRRTHIVVESDTDIEMSAEATDSDTGAVDPSLILEKIEAQIADVKEEAFSRKEILEKVEKWLTACDEESWLEEYNRDENRYSAGKGAHLILKRAEKARATVNKLPAVTEALVAKTTAWENERGITFTYDGSPLLSMLEEYMILRQEKEHERRRQRDHKRLQDQMIAEQEVLFGSKSSSMKPQTPKKLPKISTGGPCTSNRRISSIGGAMAQTPKQSSLQSTKATRHRKADEWAVPSTGSRCPDSPLSLRQLSFKSTNSTESDTTLPRRPFTPIVSVSSAHAAASLPSATATAPSECVALADDENRMPLQMPMETPKTPKTMSAAADMHEEVEYSFEERRVGFFLPGDQLKSVYS